MTPDPPSTPAHPRLLDHFGVVLLLVLASIVTLSLVDSTTSYLGRAVTHAISGAALVAAVRASGVSRRWRRLALVLVLVVLAGNIGFVVIDQLVDADLEAGLGASPDLAWVVAAILTPVVIARRILQHETVTIQTVMGAVAAYFQLAVAYSFVFQAIDALTDGGLFGYPVRTTEYMYFSLTTITTLGYGDLTPVTDVGRLVAMLEAVTGQVYLVTFVAMIVSRFAAQPPARRRPLLDRGGRP